jgi:ligand-binding sensor domain-containing protein
MRRRWLPAVLVAAGLLLLSALGGAIARRADHTETLPGWQVIRPPYEVSALARQGDVIWAGGKDGVFALDQTSGALISELQDGAPFRYVRALLVDRARNLWIGHQGGLTRYDGSAFVTYGLADGLPHDRVTCLLEDREGRIWAGTFGGAAYLEGQRWQSLTAADGLLADMVNVILQDREGGLWFGSYTAPRGGLSYLKEGRWQYFTTGEGLPHNNINALLQDESGAVWVATGFYNKGGAARLLPGAGGAWSVEKILGRDEGMPGAKVRSIYQDQQGNLWFGSEYDGIARHAKGLWEIYTVRQGLSDNEVKALLQDPAGNLWLGTHDGVTRIAAAALQAMTDDGKKN